MIYAPEDSYERQIALLALISELSKANVMVSWLYWGSNAKSIAHIPTATQALNLEPVTTYEGEPGRSTVPTIFTPEVVAKLLRNKSRIIQSCDSICIYRPTEVEWLACSVFHENMSLVRDISLLATLKMHGFNITTSRPSGW